MVVPHEDHALLDHHFAYGMEWSRVPSVLSLGHVNFSDEVTAAYRLCDGIVLFVDASEGVKLDSSCVVFHVME